MENAHFEVRDNEIGLWPRFWVEDGPTPCPHNLNMDTRAIFGA